MTPSTFDMRNASANSGVTCWMRKSSVPSRMPAGLRSASATYLTSLDGMAKPRPIEPLFASGEKMALFMPITSPRSLNSGPPELPWLMAASV
jgi:hypothetical protein